jgi:hypothetical protein
MLVLFCVYVVQTNNNEFRWKKKKLFNAGKQNIYEIAKKQKI